MESGTLLLDCILAKAGGTGSPVTFAAKLPRRSRTPEQAIELLFQWAAEAAPIEVTITESKAGPQVEIVSSAHRVVLESDDGDGA